MRTEHRAVEKVTARTRARIDDGASRESRRGSRCGRQVEGDYVDEDIGSLQSRVLAIFRRRCWLYFSMFGACGAIG